MLEGTLAPNFFFIAIAHCPYFVPFNLHQLSGLGAPPPTSVMPDGGHTGDTHHAHACSMCGTDLPRVNGKRRQCENLACRIVMALAWDACTRKVESKRKLTSPKWCSDSATWRASIARPYDLSHRDSVLSHVCVVLVDADRNFLMVRKRCNGKWEFPGGRTRPNTIAWVSAVHLWYSTTGQSLPLLQERVRYCDWRGHTRVFFLQMCREQDALYEGALWGPKHDEVRKFREKDSMYPRNLANYTRTMMPRILQNISTDHGDGNRYVQEELQVDYA